MERAHADAVVLAGWRSGKPLVEMAVAFYGRERVEAVRYTGNPMRSKLWRLLVRAGARCGAGTDVDSETDRDPGFL